MDLTLNKLPVEGFACLLDTVLYQEETQESIVPDACPDIGRVLCTETRVQLERKECMEGKVECAGTVQVTAVYLPEGEDGPRHLALAIPFRVAAAGAVGAGDRAVASVRVTAAQTRVLNPRKVLCRVELATSCQVWRGREESLCCPVADSQFALEQQTRELEHYVVTAVGERSFAFTDDVTLPAGHPAAARLLGHRLDLRCGEAKVIGSKLIFKGEVVLQCRYAAADGTLALGRWELPFSQVMELEGVEEESSCTLELVQRESQVSLAGDEEGRTLSVHMELLAQAVVRQSRTLRVFTDAYSITHDLTVTRQSLTVEQLWEESAAGQVLRETVETDRGARQVEDCFARLGPCQVRREEQEGVMTAQLYLCVLYTDEDGALQSAERTLPVSARVDLPVKGLCQARCDFDAEVQAVATAGGIELRCPLVFSYRVTAEHQLEAVAALEVQERQEADRRPSVRLRLAQKGEELWDIAKACSATQADILRANDLEGPEDLEGTLLLIPCGR